MLSKIKNCFSSESVNTGRQPELDVAKGFAILFMIWTHVFEELSPKTEGTMVLLVRSILGGPFAAPIFMICLGIGVCYSKKNGAKDLYRRGVGILGIGLLLNIFRFVLPDLIMYGVTHEENYLDATFSLFSVDILQFAGLAFVFLAVVKRFQLKNTTILIISVFASMAGMILCGVSVGNYVTDQFAGFLWGTDTRTYFPFLNWIIFPVVGMNFGSFFKQCQNKKKFYLYVTPICIGVMLIYLLLTICFGLMFSSGGAYYFLGLLDAVFFIILALMVFGLNYAALQLLPQKLFRVLMRWSKYINQIYCIHWIMIGGLGVVMKLLNKTDHMQFWQVTLIAVILLYLSDRLAVWYLDELKPRLIKRRK